MEQQPYDGTASAMRDSPWLASEDLEKPDGDGYLEAVVTIAGVLKVKDAQFKGGRKKNGFAVQFKGKERMLFLNGVNRETLKEMFGSRVVKWIGCKITLHVKPDVMLAGKRVPGIRIKPAKQSKTKAPTENQDAEPPDALFDKGSPSE